MTLPGSPLIVVSSIGDPRDRKTWSGTPHGILSAMDRQGVETREHVLGIKRPLKYFYAATNILRGYGRMLPDRIGLWSKHLRRSADAVARAEGPATFLHFGSGHLPLFKKHPGQKHFLVTDYSMHLDMTTGLLGQRVSPRYRRIALSSEARMAHQLDGLFTVARYVRDDWITAYDLSPDKVVAIGTGLGNPLTLDGYQKNYRTGHLLYVGKHGFDIKGGPLLVAGFIEALKIRPDLRLVIIANAKDPTLAPYLSTIREHPSIDFHQSGTPDFVELVKGAALYVGPAEREPWGLIYLESLMCETPVLGLNRSAMSELTDGGRLGFLVEEATAQAVGRAILDAMSDPERLARMGRAGREFVETTFTWDRVATTMLSRMEDRGGDSPHPGAGRLA